MASLHPPCRQAILTALLAGAAGLLPAAETNAPAEGKHVLYLGLDVSLTLNDVTSPVVDADNLAVQVDANGQRRRFLLRHGGDFKTAVVPRVAKSSVTIERLREERTYSRGTDPRKQALAQQMILATAQAAAEEHAERQMLDAQRNVDAALSAQGAARAAAAANPQLRVTHTGPSADQLQAASSAASSFSSLHSSPLYDINTLGADAAGRDAFNALGVNFTISAPAPLKDVYGVMRVLFTDPAKPTQQASSIRFFSLPDLQPKPTKVFFLHEHLPPGYKLERYEIHVYSGGREIATNLSNNRVELTLDEIHQFLVLKHLSEHAGGSGPVAIATELLDHDLAAHVTKEMMNLAVDVAVDEKGRVTSLTLDPRSSSGPVAYITSVLRETRFLPAIERGKPVAGSGRFVLEEFLP